MKKHAMKLLVSSLCLGLLGCSLSVEDLNNPDIDTEATPESINATAVGLAIGSRVDFGSASGYLVQTGILGRELYNFDQNDPRFVSEVLLGSALSSGGIGSSFWANQYNTIRSGNLLLSRLEAVEGLSPEQKEGLRGWTKTLMAMEFMVIASTHPDTGAPIAVAGALGTELAPIVDNATVWAHISTLLDEANAHLEGGGMAFSFSPPEGYGSFGNPAAFAQVNRGLAARAYLNRGNYQDALDVLTESFITATPGDAQLALGVSHVFGVDSGDTANALVSPNIYAHPSIRADAEAGDARLSKITAVDPFEFAPMVAAQDKFTLYPAPTSSVPIIRNEELILIRAEANWGLEQYVAAVADLNFIRNESGGLGNTLATTDEEIRDEILLQRRYSLLFEGHQWADARRLGMLSMLPNPSSGTLHTSYPIPQQELDARGL